MVSIAADNQEIERSLQKLVALSCKDGAQFSGDLVLRCVDGSLSIEAPPESVGEVLIRLPWNCLVPIQPFRLLVANDHILISSYDAGLDSACVARMEAMLELYNIADKFAEHRRRSPLPLIVSHPQLLQYVVQRRGQLNSTYQKLWRSGGEDALLLHTFFNTRVFDYKLETAQDLSYPILMPVLDLMNHHIYGAAYRDDLHAKDRSLIIRRPVPLPGRGNECFAFYGPYDAFDTWITYDFVDGSVPFVCSVAMIIDLPSLGTIRLAGMHKSRAKKDLPASVKDLWFYIPKLLAKGADHLEVASLLIPGPEAPQALRQTLRFLITEMSPGHPRKDDLVRQAEEQILLTNRTYYRNLMTLLRTLSPNDPLQRPTVDNFIRMCELQLARIQVYSACAEG